MEPACAPPSVRYATAKKQPMPKSGLHGFMDAEVGYAMP